MLPFIKKYKPSKPEDIVGQDTQLSQLDDFINNYKDQNKKALFLWGGSGVGKTVMAEVLSQKHNLEMIEISASDFRNKDQINQKLGNAIAQQSLFSTGKVILVDEIDGLSGTKDRGGIQAIVKLIDKTTFPIILTAYNPYNTKLNTVRSRSILLECKPLDYLAIFQILKNIVKNENITTTDEILQSLARRSGGDARAAINDLQTLSKGKQLTKESLDDLHDRAKVESILQALLKVFKTTDPKISLPAFDHVEEDMDKILLWLDENLPKEYTKPKDLAQAYESLSRVDVFRGRIRRWQHWRFMVYMNQLMTAGISLAKDEKYKSFTQYKPTMRLLKIWQANMKYAKKKAIASKIAQNTHSSTKQVLQSTFPYFQEAFKKNKDYASQMTEYLELDKDEIAWLNK
jgi:replication factor C large subunit